MPCCLFSFFLLCVFCVCVCVVWCVFVCVCCVMCVVCVVGLFTGDLVFICLASGVISVTYLSFPYQSPAGV